MDRFPETIFPNPALAHRRGDDNVTFSVAVHICENCRKAAERLTLVPEFLYMGCDDCMEEALAEIAKEQAEAARIGCLVAAGLTPDEVLAFTRLVEGKVA